MLKEGKYKGFVKELFNDRFYVLVDEIYYEIPWLENEKAKLFLNKEIELDLIKTEISRKLQAHVMWEEQETDFERFYNKGIL